MTYENELANKPSRESVGFFSSSIEGASSRVYELHSNKKNENVERA